MALEGREIFLEIRGNIPYFFFPSKPSPSERLALLYGVVVPFSQHGEQIQPVPAFPPAYFTAETFWLCHNVWLFYWAVP